MPDGAGLPPDLGRHQGSLGGRRGEGNVFSLVVDPTDGRVLYAVGASGVAPYSKVSKSVDGGRTWRALPASPSLVSALTIDPANPQVLFAAVEDAWTSGGGTARSR